MTAGVREPMLARRFTVQGVKDETHDTFTIDLRPSHGNRDFRFLPGQFNMLYAFGAGEAPVSISGDPGEPGTLVHTIRAVGTVTRSIRKMKPKSMLGVRGPFGNPWPLEDAEEKDVLVVAGGIGLAPLRPALYHMRSRRGRYGEVALLYGARTPADLLYAGELEKWSDRGFAVHVTVDRADEGWRGNVGVVTTLIKNASFDPRNAVAMVCGPEVMMRFAVQELQKAGVRDDRIHISMERSMKCGVGLCGHCQLGPAFVCRDGPVFRYDRIAEWFGRREV